MPIISVGNYIGGQWTTPVNGREVPDAIYGKPVALVSHEGADVRGMLEHARNVGGPALRKLTFHERARRLRALATYLLERKERYYQLSMLSGATRRDCAVDVDGGIGTLFSFSSLARRELPDERFVLEGVERLSKNGTFVGRHILTPREGAALHINAFNFPVWGMLEKAAPGWVAGVPQIVKPATPTAYITEAVVRDILESGLLPEGALQLVVGTPPDLLEHLEEQDLVTFTGSAATARKLRVHPRILERSVPFNTEADSLNCIVLGESVTPDAPEFELFVREVFNEMTIKAGQRCTAIRRAIAPRDRVEAVLEALRRKLEGLRIGDPHFEVVQMGPLVGASQRDGVRGVIGQLRDGCELVHGERDLELHGGDLERGGFLSPTVLYADQPLRVDGPHDLEPFGPVVTVMAYSGLDEAVELARRGRGSLVGSLVTFDKHEARDLFFGCSSHHGRLHILNRESAPESTGHGSPLPNLVHGGPGRAGGGEELGGLRAVRHYMVRTAVQSDPTTLAFIGGEHVRGARVLETPVHPFRKHWEDLEIGESLLTHRRTVTETDLVNFASVSGDHFYAHTDEIGARESLFGKRVAHGYFLVSMAAGLFVDPGVGPVLANYGLESLRFIEPVGIGDTLRARLTVKRKLPREQKLETDRPAGVVEWDVELTNQDGVTVALYSILTLVAKRPLERAEEEASAETFQRVLS